MDDMYIRYSENQLSDFDLNSKIDCEIQKYILKLSNINSLVNLSIYNRDLYLLEFIEPNLIRTSGYLSDLFFFKSQNMNPSFESMFNLFLAEYVSPDFTPKSKLTLDLSRNSSIRFMNENPFAVESERIIYASLNESQFDRARERISFVRERIKSEGLENIAQSYKTTFELINRNEMMHPDSYFSSVMAFSDSQFNDEFERVKYIDNQFKKNVLLSILNEANLYRQELEE